METAVTVIDFLRTEVWGVSLIHWMMPVLVVGGIVVMLLLFAKRHRVKIETMCPVLKKKETLELDVNVFRDPSKNVGLDVTACTEFLGGRVTCGKKCLHNPDVRAVHEKEKLEHQEEIRKSSAIIP